MKYSCVVINGKFCSQKTTGVQRYAAEIVKALDKIKGNDVEMVLAVDDRIKNLPHFKNIKSVKVGRLSGVAWEQISLAFYVLTHKALCVNLCNMAPILTPHIVTLHDVSYKVNKSFFSKKFMIWYNFVFSLIIHRIKEIFTVSEFSKKEICRVYKKTFKNITVTYNGWQHMEKVLPNPSVLEKYGLKKGNFYFSVSSLAVNKNFRYIALVAQNNPEYDFIVSGVFNKKVFGDIFDFEIPENLKFLGYASDEDVKELMKNCKAFLFPTFYEGFGIPVLEAISQGAKAIVSDRSCMREIFGDCVYYITPNNPNVDLDKLIEAPTESAEKLLEKYNWEYSAQIIYDKISEALKKASENRRLKPY